MTSEVGKFINKTENNYLYHFNVSISEFGNENVL